MFLRRGSGQINFGLITVIAIIFILVKTHAFSVKKEIDGAPPRIVEHPKSLTVPRGDPATLNCAAEGNPKPKITWFRDGMPVTTTEQDPHSHRLLLPSGSLFFLSIKQGKKENDAGVYQCMATNSIGRAVSTNASLISAVLREEFRVTPDDVSAATGEQAKFHCAPPKGHPIPNLSWLRNGYNISLEEEGSRISILDNGTLWIRDVRQTDEGEYVCIASNAAARRSSPPAILDVIVSPFWVKAPRDVIGIRGSAVEIACRVGGDPVPAVTWRRVGGRMPLGRAAVIKDRGLRLAPVHPEDEGIYVCEAANRASGISANATIVVQTAPQLVELPGGSADVQEDGLLQLSCGAEGSPPPIVYWTKEGSQSVLPSEMRALKDSQDDLSGVVSIYKVLKAERHHSGRYICGAVNSAGGIAARVGVRVSPIPQPPPPVISVPPFNQTIPLGSQGAFTCRVWGNPSPSVVWSHKGVPVLLTGRFKVLQDNTLTIEEAVPEDAGVYTCRAFSSAGSTSASAVLTVSSSGTPKTKTVSADALPGPPPTPTVVQSNGTAALISWSPPSRQGASPVKGYTLEYYSSSARAWHVAARNVRSTTYTLVSLDPSHSYGVTVRAFNSYGVSEPSGVAEIIGGLPKWPTSKNLEKASVTLEEATPIGSNSAKLLWKMEGEGNVEGFYIRLYHISREDPVASFIISPIKKEDFNWPMFLELSRSNLTVVTVLNAGPGGSSYVLHGLYNYRAYTVFLVPFDGTIEGRPSNSRSFITMEAAPSGPPQNVVVQLTNATSASVFWSPPFHLQSNGPITAYQLEVIVINKGSESVFLSRPLLGNATSTLVHDLTLGHSYHVTLAAATNVGRGPFSQPVLLHVDPVLLHPLAKSGSSLTSLEGEVWIIGMIGAAIFSLLLLIVVFLLLWRRHFRNKTLGSGDCHVGVHKTENMNGGDGCLWQEYSGWQLEKCALSLPNGEGKMKMSKDENGGISENDKNLLGCPKASEKSFRIDGLSNTLRRLKGMRSPVGIPSLPCVPPPGMPTPSRSHTPCYCSVTRVSSSMDSAYSEAHFAPTASFPIRGGSGSCCPSHHYDSASPLPPYPEMVGMRTPLHHHRMCRNSAVYESAGSLQYAPPGAYFFPSSTMTSSFASTVSSDATPSSVERGVQSSLPSLTYEAIRTLGDDFEAFRQRHKDDDEDEDKLPNEGKTIMKAPPDRPPSFDPPAPPPTSLLSSKTSQAGTLTPGGSLPPIEVDVAPLGEGETDEEECSCSCSESSVYAETEFAEEVRASLREPCISAEVCLAGRRHKHHRRPLSGYSTDSVYSQIREDRPKKESTFLTTKSSGKNASILLSATTNSSSVLI